MLASQTPECNCPPCPGPPAEGTAPETELDVRGKRRNPVYVRTGLGSVPGATGQRRDVQMRWAHNIPAAARASWDSRTQCAVRSAPDLIHGPGASGRRHLQSE